MTPCIDGFWKIKRLKVTDSVGNYNRISAYGFFFEFLTFECLTPQKPRIYGTPVSSRAISTGRKFGVYQAKASITVGTYLNGRAIEFRNVEVIAECGVKTTYHVDFEYQNITTQRDPQECISGESIDGSCIFPSYEETVELQYVQKVVSDYQFFSFLDVLRIIFGQKIEIFKIALPAKLPFGLVLLGNSENLNFWPKIILKTSQNDQISGPVTNFRTHCRNQRIHRR